mgnify:CR=1 FL=1
MHDTIDDAITHVSLLIADRNGSLNSHFEAITTEIPGNQFHLTNVIVNMLENALKYSEGKPKIDVAFNPVSNYVYLDLIGDVGASINKQGVTNVTWQKISDNGACGCVISSYSNSILKGLAQGNCNDWSMYVKITASNS